MSIVLARVDNRLLHGQILSAWVPALRADAIVVLDDEAASNALLQSAMELALPPDVTLRVVPVGDARSVLGSLPPASRALVLLRDVADAVRALEAGASLGPLNLGNVHFSPGRAMVSQAVYLSPAEVEALSELEERGTPVELKTLPRESPLPLTEIRRRVRQAAAP